VAEVPTILDSETPEVDPDHQPRVGELTRAWRIALTVTWVAAFAAYMAVWKVSDELGLATWWIGPRSNPQPMAVRLIPFLITATGAAIAGSHLTRVPWTSLAGAGSLALVAAGDLSRSGGIATIEFAIAGAVALVSLASFTGRYRRAAAGDTADR
jgi:hypothetical protein